ncbi:hypothetical protein Aduo_005693 [Ancylostoma duodenale]
MGMARNYRELAGSVKNVRGYGFAGNPRRDAYATRTKVPASFPEGSRLERLERMVMEDCEQQERQKETLNQKDQRRHRLARLETKYASLKEIKDKLEIMVNPTK